MLATSEDKYAFVVVELVVVLFVTFNPKIFATVELKLSIVPDKA